MSYIERSLGDGEKIVARARFHWLYNLRAWLALLLPLALLVAAMVYADPMVREGLAILWRPAAEESHQGTGTAPRICSMVRCMLTIE